MRLCLWPTLVAIATVCVSCHDNPAANNAVSDNIYSAGAKLPPDVLALTKPLIKGRLYKDANLEDGSIINFDTSQHILILDTTDALFVKARIEVDSSSYTGFVLKAILPE